MKKTLRFSAIGILAAAVISCSMFDYSGMVGQKYALVYGVSRYTMDPAGPNLKFPHADASAISAVLASNGYAVQSRWVDTAGDVWTGGTNSGLQIGSLQTSALDGSAPTGEDLGDPIAPSKVNILLDIQGLVGTIQPDDVLVIYFSGHGTQDAGTSPPREFFDPYGSVMQYTGDNKFYGFSVPSVRDDDLRAAFDAINTPRKVLILDTCNSGGFIGNQLESDWTPSASIGAVSMVGPATLIQAISNYASMQSSPTGLSPYGAQVLSASGKDELSWETDSIGHGVMTWFLLQGLQGLQADLNQDGYVTVLEAFAYAKAGVDQNWNSGNSSSAFEPHVSGGPVDFVLF